MSETTDLVAGGTQDAAAPATEAPAASGTAGSPRRRGNGLSGMLLPELQRLAAELGISGTGRMRKGDLVAAISARQVGGADSTASAGPVGGTAPTAAPRVASPRPAVSPPPRPRSRRPSPAAPTAAR